MALFGGRGGRRRGSTPTAPRLELGGGGLRVADASVPLYSVGIPYWELRPASWDTHLESLLAIGLRFVRLDVPWRQHETRPGVYDWGVQRPELDLARLLGMASQRGLLVAMRPGPWIGSSSGASAVADLPTHVAESGLDPLDDEFRAAVRGWQVALCNQLSPFIHPRGPIVAWIAGSPPAPAGQRGGGLLDRSDAAIAFYQRYLADAHPALIDAQSRRKEPEPRGPQGPDELQTSLAWIEAGETAHRSVVADQLAARPRASFEREPEGMPLPALVTVADSPVGSGADAHAARTETDGIWLELPHGAQADFGLLRLTGLRAAALDPARGVHAIPGTSPSRAAPGCLDGPTVATVLAMCGVRALDFDRAVGEASAAVRSDGTADLIPFERWRDVIRSLDAIDHPTLERRADCLLLQNRELARLCEACTDAARLPTDLASLEQLSALRALPRPLGMRDHPELDTHPMFSVLFDGLRLSAVPFAVADTSIASARLGDFRCVLVPSFERMSRGLAEILFEWAHAGGTLVLGPRLPRADWSFAPLEVGARFEVKDRHAKGRLGPLELRDFDVFTMGEALLETELGPVAVARGFGAGRVATFGFRLERRAVPDDGADAGMLADVARALVSPASVDAVYPASDPVIETELHEGTNRRFLFIANPTDRERPASIPTKAGERLREVRGSGAHVRGGERFAVPARSVLLREIVAP